MHRKLTLKTLLLTAKYIARKEDSSHIDVVHMKAAFQCLVIISVSKNAETLRNALNQIGNSSEHDSLVVRYKGSINQTLLNEVANAPVLPFSEKVANIVKLVPTAPSHFGVNTNNTLFSLPEEKPNVVQRLVKFEALKDALNSEVHGQEDAVEALIDSLVKNDWQHNTNKPKGLFLFIGPPATGKTFLSERFAHHLGEGYVFNLVDMAQYTNSNESFALVGAKKSYNDSEPGRLTQFIKNNPKTVVVLDEFEKAHSQVLLSLMQIFSRGFITDEHTQEVIDCRQVILILTSNLGASFYNNEPFLAQLNSHPHQTQKVLLSHLSKETKIERDRKVKAIPNELLSRLSQGSVLLFKKLQLPQLCHIANQQLADDTARFSQQYGIHFVPPNTNISQLLLLHFAPLFDIRDIKSKISNLIIDPITDYFRQSPSDLPTTIRIRLSLDARAFLANNTTINDPKALALKHQTVNFKTNRIINNDEVVIELDKPLLHQIVFSEDVGVEGGMTMDFPSIPFSAIAGHKHIKSRLIEVSRLLKQRSILQELDLPLPAGMLLYGAPGTGKTMLAKAFAHEAGLPFIACSGSDMLSESFISRIFERARQYAPSIIFIDEIDALPTRGTMGPVADALVNRLLVEIDGFTSTKSEIFIIGATNFKHKLDSALTRSGRLDLHFQVPAPDKTARKWLLSNQLKHPLYDSNINIDELLLPTTGLTGADFTKIHREAILAALRNKDKSITQARLLEEINTLKYGAKQTQRSSQELLRETAFHEAGHAVISYILMPERTIEQISIIAREHTLGMVSYASEQPLKQSRSYWQALTCVALAGRAAQVEEFGDNGIDTGASSDLEQANHYAYIAIAKFGMHAKLYNMNLAYLEKVSDTQLYREMLETLIYEWIDSSTQTTQQLVQAHWQKITRIANELIANETINEQQMLDIFAQAKNQ